MSIPILIFAGIAVALAVLFVMGLSQGGRGRASKRDGGDGHVYGGDGGGRRVDKDGDSDRGDGNDGGGSDGGGSGGGDGGGGGGGGD